MSQALNVPRSATASEIRTAWRRMALRYHPDKKRDGQTANDQDYHNVAEAYEVLGDLAKRYAYDWEYENKMQPCDWGLRD